MPSSLNDTWWINFWDIKASFKVEILQWKKWESERGIKSAMRQNIGFLCVKTRKMPCFVSWLGESVLVSYFSGSRAKTLSHGTHISSLIQKLIILIKQTCFEIVDSRMCVRLRRFALVTFNKKTQVLRKKPARTLKNQYEKMRSGSTFILDFFPVLDLYLPFLLCFIV